RQGAARPRPRRPAVTHRKRYAAGRPSCTVDHEQHAGRHRHRLPRAPPARHRHRRDSRRLPRLPHAEGLHLTLRPDLDPGDRLAPRGRAAVTSGVRTTGTAGKSKESGRVRWGFIGAGDVAEVKSGPAFSLVEGSSVSVIMRRSADKAKDYAERHGVPRWTTDAAEVIAATDVDAVYVATPPSSHAHYTRLAAQAGKPVYVEKPMARTAAEAEAMLRACQQAGVPLFVAYYRRALPR